MTLQSQTLPGTRNPDAYRDCEPVFQIQGYSPEVTRAMEDAMIAGMRPMKKPRMPRVQTARSLDLHEAILGATADWTGVSDIALAVELTTASVNSRLQNMLKKRQVIRRRATGHSRKLEYRATPKCEWKGKPVSKTPTQDRVMEVLGPGMLTVEVAKLSGLSLKNTTTVLGEMFKSGLVSRVWTKSERGNDCYAYSPMGAAE